MAINSLQNRDDFTQYVLRKLGEPVIQVNASIEQVQDRIDDALKLFYERHLDGTEQVYIIYTFDSNDLLNGYVQLEPDIIEVQDVLVTNPSAGIFSVEYQLQLENLFSTSLITNFGDLTYYYMTQANISLINRIFVPWRQFTYNQHTNKLIIAGGNKSTNNLSGFIVIKARKIIYGDSNEVPSWQTNTDSNGKQENVLINGQIWNNRWLQKYATALVKRQWAENMSKFQNIPLLGGVTISGTDLMNEANREIEDLTDELESRYELPVDFSIG